MVSRGGKQMTNYPKKKRLRGSMAPKTDKSVALSGTNSDETENKQESLSGTNSGEEKEVALSGSNSIEEEIKKKPNWFEKYFKEIINNIKEKLKHITFKGEK